MVVPSSLYTIPGALHGALRCYKDGVSDASRRLAATWVASLLARFIHDHGDCLRRARSEWDAITTVPSSSGRESPHPLVQAMELVPWLSSQHIETLEPGPERLGHSLASDRGFIAVRDVRGMRLLVVDDTYTTGARAQSAASALECGGGRVVAVVPVGRVVPRRARLMDPPERFAFGRCCLEPTGTSALPAAS